MGALIAILTFLVVVVGFLASGSLPVPEEIRNKSANA